MADIPQAETVAAAIEDSPYQAQAMGTMGIIPAESVDDESLPLKILAADAIHAELLAVAGIVDVDNMGLVPVEVLAAEQLIEETLAVDIGAAESLALEYVATGSLVSDRLAVAAADCTAAATLESQRLEREDSLRQALAELQNAKEDSTEAGCGSSGDVHRSIHDTGDHLSQSSNSWIDSSGVTGRQQAPDHDKVLG